MTYDAFTNIITGLQSCSKNVCELRTKGVDLVELVEPYHEIISTLLAQVYTKEGLDWFDWFAYESDFGEKDWNVGRPDSGTSESATNGSRYGAWDADGNPICYSIKSTWEYLNAYLRVQ